MKKLKIFYAASCGDVIGTYHHWKKQEDDPYVIWITDSSQFYDLIQKLDAEAFVVSYCKRIDSIKEGKFTILQRPKKEWKGIGYHLYQLWYGIKLCFWAIKFQSDIAIIEEGMSHWFIFKLMQWYGIQTISSLKCVLWPVYLPMTRKQKILNILNQSFFKKSLAINCISKKITTQVQLVTHGQHPTLFEFVTIYSKRNFAEITAPCLNRKCFNILFAGRIIENKGIFDLVKIAVKLKELGFNNFHFYVCGSGPDEIELEKKIAEASLQNIFFIQGYCTHSKLKEMFSISHVFIVPTQKTFIEGLPNIVLESILAGRPVVTSAVCPAIYSVMPAVFEVEPENIEEYSNALIKLYSDEEFYEVKCKACLALKDLFYDMNNSWQNALEKSIKLFPK